MSVNFTSGRPTLKFSDRENIDNLVASIPSLKRNLLLKISQDAEIAGYASIVKEGAIPSVTQPPTYAGTNESTIKTHAIKFKKYLEDKEKVPKRNCKFVSLLLDCCDSQLRTCIEDTREYSKAMAENPIDVVYLSTGLF